MNLAIDKIVAVLDMSNSTSCLYYSAYKGESVTGVFILSGTNKNSLLT